MFQRNYSVIYKVSSKNVIAINGEFTGLMTSLIRTNVHEEFPQQEVPHYN